MKCRQAVFRMCSLHPWACIFCLCDAFLADYYAECMKRVMTQTIPTPGTGTHVTNHPPPSACITGFALMSWVASDPWTPWKATPLTLPRGRQGRCSAGRQGRCVYLRPYRPQCSNPRKRVCLLCLALQIFATIYADSRHSAA